MKANFARPTAAVALLAFAACALALPPYAPSAKGLVASYREADSLRSDMGKAFNVRLDVHWYADGAKLWYESSSPGGVHRYISVDSATGQKSPLFDQQKLADALTKKTGHTVTPDSMALTALRYDEAKQTLTFRLDRSGYECDLTNYTLKSADVAAPRPFGRFGGGGGGWNQNLNPPETDPVVSPNGKWTARCDGNNVFIKPDNGQEFQATQNGSPDHYYARVQWSPDSRFAIAATVTPGDRKSVYLTASGTTGDRAGLRKFVYDLPGDKVDTFRLWVIDPANRTVKEVNDDINYGDIPQLRWTKDGSKFRYDRIERGYSRWRIFEVDPSTAQVTTLVDDHPSTFFDSTSMYLHFCRDTDEIIWRSEMSGWGQLYLTDGNGHLENPITQGSWVVRGVTSVNEASRQIVFQASGMKTDEDPYFIHYYRVNFDGTGLTPLTPADGSHQAVFSPNGQYLIDTYSTVYSPPIHELRNAKTGALIATLEKADIGPLTKSGWKAPEVFVAKGRDGKTDIWGIVYRPRRLDANKSYPIVEDIYAGPQDSFVPKTFSAYRPDESLAELGFIVVQMDGMGTRNRSKAFQDVCFKNLGDSGFPDRILWIKALAAKYPYMDLNRVGIFGTSAGGQESTAGLLFHPEFYKVGVSSCGCHDNRMDKLWWNEQWMGYPVGPEYSASSNIDHASNLQGSLMLIDGELDTNVPPANTYRLADALEKSGKDFDLVVIPGSDHTNGGPYGEHKRRDFLVEHLLGVNAPNWADIGPAEPIRLPGSGG